MQIQTHVLSGWCIGNYLPFNARERVFCMLAASAADLDGAGRLYSEQLYWDYHHKLGHNLLFGLILSILLAAFSSRRLLAFITYLALFHLHLFMDYWGSGPDWHIHYLWPFSSARLINPHAWAFFSWQNLTVALALVLWSLWIAIQRGRTPIELLAPRLDREWVAWLRLNRFWRRRRQR